MIEERAYADAIGDAIDVWGDKVLADVIAGIAGEIRQQAWCYESPMDFRAGIDAIVRRAGPALVERDRRVAHDMACLSSA